MTQKTLYNHGGRYRSAAVDAFETIKVIERKFSAFQKAAQYYNGAEGDSNRLNDFVRDLKGSLHNLEVFLEHAGAPRKSV